MAKKEWRVLARPLLETVLNNHVQHHRVPQPLILHGPRGVGKTTFIQQRLMNDWNKGPHVTGYVDFAETVKDNHHPTHNASYPWASFSVCEPPKLFDLISQLILAKKKISQLENCLQTLVENGVRLGTISSQQIYSTLRKWHSIDTALSRIVSQSGENKVIRSKRRVSDKFSTSKLWDRALLALSARINAKEIDEILGVSAIGKIVPREEASYYREALVAIKLAKEVLTVQKGWRTNALKHLNVTGGFSRSLANSATDWPCLLLELSADDSTVRGSLYHYSLIWRIIASGANERCLPIILVTSDSYYSYQAYMDFGFPDIFISRETFGWSPQEAKLHMVPDYFSESEWKVIPEVLGPNPRHLFELYALKQSSCSQKIMDVKGSTFEDIVDAYLAYLQMKNRTVNGTDYGDSMHHKMALFLLCLCYSYLLSACNIIGVDGGREMSKEELIDVENELKLLNKPSVKTIKTKYSEIYDCVDFYKQPAFDHPLLQNHTFHPKIRPFSIPIMSGGIKLSKEHSESHLIPVGCPVGTVPVKRTTRDDIIRAKLHSEKYGSNSVTNLGQPDHHYAIVMAKPDSQKKYTGAATELSVWNPHMQSSDQYSSSRLKIQNGQDSIEVGWTVNPTLYGHDKTHIYIYLNAGQLQCFNTRCPGFVIVNNDIPIDRVLDKSTTEDQLYALLFAIHKDTGDGNWWLFIGPKLLPIGFWPRQLFTSLSDVATMIEWGGEVFSPPNIPSPPMGSGEEKVIYHTGHAAICALHATVEEGDTTLRSATNTILYKDSPRYDIKDAGFAFRGLGHVVLFGGSGGAIWN